MYLYAGIRMLEETFPYESSEEFYEAIKDDIPSLMESFPEESKIRKTIVVPRVFDMMLNRKIRGDLLRFYGIELNYSDLLIGFAMIGIATWISNDLVQKIVGDLNILDAFDEARKKRKQK